LREKNSEPQQASQAAYIERRVPQPDFMEDGARFYDTGFKAHVQPVLPGEFAVTMSKDDMLATIVGSCVTACVRDPVLGVGGMNHFMLPGDEAPALRYGHFAMQRLLSALFGMGAKRERLEIRLFGGASLLKSPTSLGDENIRFIKNYLQEEGLQETAADLGGVYPRRIHYVPATGRVFRLLMRRTDDANIFTREVNLRQKIQQEVAELKTAASPDDESRIPF
jgi:chemotaxis protein CheD